MLFRLDALTLTLTLSFTLTLMLLLVVLVAFGAVSRVARRRLGLEGVVVCRVVVRRTIVVHFVNHVLGGRGRVAVHDSAGWRRGRRFVHDVHVLRGVRSWRQGRMGGFMRMRLRGRQRVCDVRTAVAHQGLVVGVVHWQLP